jgi:hypothetical protein
MFSLALRILIALRIDYHSRARRGPVKRPPETTGIVAV